MAKPVVVNRDEGGAVHAFVNRCAHRGALVRRELSGNAKNHTCIYHQWCYGLDGGMTAIPFRRGVRGQGGLGPAFEMGEHGLRRLKLSAVNGAWFGTLAEDGETLEDYLGSAVLVSCIVFFKKHEGTRLQPTAYSRQFKDLRRENLRQLPR